MNRSFKGDDNTTQIKILPMTYAKIIWDKVGNYIDFISSHDPAWSGMGTINITHKGLFIVDNNGGSNKSIKPTLVMCICPQT